MPAVPDAVPSAAALCRARPDPVMARAVLERCLDAKYLDGWFDRVSQKQYTRPLLFSTVFELMSQVVFRHPQYNNGT